MPRSRVVAVFILLGFLAACDNPRLTEAGSIPGVSNSALAENTGASVVYDEDGNVVARSLTTDEAIAYFEKRAAQDPEFLDTPHEYYSLDDDRVKTFIWRDFLEGLKAQKRSSSVQRSQLSSDFVPLSPDSGCVFSISGTPWPGMGFVGEIITIGAETDVDPHEPPCPSTYEAKVKFTVTGISQEPINLTNTKDPSESFPWHTSTEIQSINPGNYTLTTIHSVKLGYTQKEIQRQALGQIDPQ